MSDWYGLAQNISIAYSHIIDDRNYYMDGDTLVVSPVYDPVEAFVDHNNINPQDVDTSRLEDILREKLK